MNSPCCLVALARRLFGQSATVPGVHRLIDCDGLAWNCIVDDNGRVIGLGMHALELAGELTDEALHEWRERACAVLATGAATSGGGLLDRPRNHLRLA